MRWIPAVSFLLGAVACGTPASGEVAAPAAPVAPQPPAVPEKLQALADAVAEIPDAVADPTHGKLVAALSLLADVLEPDDAEAARRIRQHSTTLMRSPPNERGHADIVRTALDEALDAYARQLPHEPTAATRAAYVAARRAHARMSSSAPLRFQLDEVAATLRALTNIAAFERDLRPLFPPRHAADIAYAPDRLRRATVRASELVTGLAGERTWAPAGRRAAAALDAFADAFSASRGSSDQARWTSLIATIRFEALQLEQEGAVSTERSDRIKAGLAACVGALRVMTPPRSPVFTRLVKRADAAVERIRPDASFVFQRGIIQESFRTIADALLLVGAPPAR